MRQVTNTGAITEAFKQHLSPNATSKGPKTVTFRFYSELCGAYFSVPRHEAGKSQFFY